MSRTINLPGVIARIYTSPVGGGIAVYSYDAVEGHYWICRLQAGVSAKTAWAMSKDGWIMDPVSHAAIPSTEFTLDKPYHDVLTFDLDGGAVIITPMDNVISILQKSVADSTAAASALAPDDCRIYMRFFAMIILLLILWYCRGWMRA
jgi:hypothetical protein